MRIKDGLSSLSSSSNVSSVSSKENQVGKVYGVINTENTPTEELFNYHGGFSGQGTIFYLNYDQSKNKSDVDLKDLATAKPFFPQFKYYPVVGELVLLFDLPSLASQVSTNSSQKYYIVLSLWNNAHHNALLASDDDKLGITFNEKININNLQTFEGDYILEGRFGNSIRFGSTVDKLNPWSEVGKNGDPITIITNNHKFIEKTSQPYIENINTDGSSIYFTSTQQIQLIPDRSILNKITSPISINKYNKNQIILNSDRVVINSKKDEIMLFAKTNIDLYTKQVINLNADDRIHLNSPMIFLGSKKNGDLPDEPMLLGGQTIEVLTDLFSALNSFASSLTQAMTPPPGAPLVEVNLAAIQLTTEIEPLMGKLTSVLSKTNFVV